jgi:hypothetical protein
MEEKPAPPAPAPADGTPAVPVAPPKPVQRDAKELLKSGEFLVVVGILAGCIFLAAVILALVDRWRRRPTGRRADAPLALTSFREMYENGEITQGEYERIRAKAAAKIKKEVGVSNPSTAAAPRAEPDRPVGPDAPPPAVEPGG